MNAQEAAESRRAMATVAASLPEHLVREAREVFALLDVDGSGFIDQSELGELMRRFGHPLSPQELGRMQVDLDMNDDGKIDLCEFLGVLHSVSQDEEEEDIEAHYRSIFEKANKSGSGEIDAAEMSECMGGLGMPLSIAEAQSMIEEADRTRRGKLTFRDFRAHMHLLYGEEYSWQARQQRLEDAQKLKQAQEAVQVHRRASAAQRRESLSSLQRAPSAASAAPSR
eukprot:TRINITY_DN27823_c0_g1_i1.p1 TRINITY_DN27823_c0_g1~~TRINITY_DN27823_c0_g1_i1.p1  ORF type:complete len:254 (+),score=95.43 TRINITY_DN27823_c0_g1_i1:86-763(+)